MEEKDIEKLLLEKLNSDKPGRGVLRRAEAEMDRACGKKKTFQFGRKIWFTAACGLMAVLLAVLVPLGIIWGKKDDDIGELQSGKRQSIISVADFSLKNDLWLLSFDKEITSSYLYLTKNEEPAYIRETYNDEIAASLIILFPDFHASAGNPFQEYNNLQESFTVAENSIVVLFGKKGKAGYINFEYQSYIYLMNLKTADDEIIKSAISELFL